MMDNKNINKQMKDEPKIWNHTEVQLLKKWGEQSASYRVLHNRSYRKYKWLTAIFTIPVIIISTLTGTANFSQGTIIQIYPSIDVYLPLFIGTLNLIAGIITTLGQFLRVSELNEANRNASISYGKFARNICTELSLPPNERTYNGLDFIQICRNEMDRLIEQSPEISMKIINKFEHNSKFKNIIKPDLINISPIIVYQPSKDEKSKELVAGAANKFRSGFINTKLKDLQPTIDSSYNNSTSSKFKEFNIKRDIELELTEIRDNKVENNNQIKKKISSIFENKFNVNNDNNDNNDNTKFNMKKAKNIFEHNEVKDKPQTKIKCFNELLSKDNLDKLKNIRNNEENNKQDVSINIDNLKNDLVDNTNKNIENNLDDIKNTENIVLDILRDSDTITENINQKINNNIIIGNNNELENNTDIGNDTEDEIL